MSTDIPASLPQIIDVTDFCKNGDAPQAALWQGFTRRVNRIWRWNRKEVFRWNGRYSWGSASGTATVNRWRFRCHTGPMAKQFAVMAMVAMDDTKVAVDPNVKVTFTAVGAGVDGSAGFFFGESPSTATVVDAVPGIAIMTSYVTCTADETYEVVWQDKDGSRLVGGCIWEVSKFGSPQNGYLRSGYTIGSPIYDSKREALLEAATNYWNRGAAHLFNWCVDLGASPRTRSGTSSLNLIDDSSSTVSSATPGLVVDLTYCNTLSQAEVPVVFAVYASKDATGTRDGIIVVKNSSGTVLLTVTVPVSSAAGWYTTTGTLPASEAKYDIQSSIPTGGGGGAGPLSVGAVSLYQYLA